MLLFQIYYTKDEFKKLLNKSENLIKKIII